MSLASARARISLAAMLASSAAAAQTDPPPPPAAEFPVEPDAAPEPASDVELGAPPPPPPSSAPPPPVYRAPVYVPPIYAPPPGPDRAGSGAARDEETRRYGWQTLIVDFSALGLFLAGASSDDGGGMIVTSVLGYYFGAPIVHWAHGHAGKGFGSLGIRAGATVVSAAVIGSCFENGNCESAPYLIVAAMTAPIWIDAAFLAREPVERESAQIRVAPIVTPTARGLGLGGAF